MTFERVSCDELVVDAAQIDVIDVHGLKPALSRVLDEVERQILIDQQLELAGLESRANP